MVDRNEICRALYGVVWNTKLGIQQAVQMNITSGQIQDVIYEFPSRYGGPFAITRMSTIDPIDGKFFVLIAYNDYKNQMLFTINLADSTATSAQLPIDYLVPTIAYDNNTNTIVGVGFSERHAAWEFLSIDPKSGGITSLARLPDPETFVYDYTVNWLDQGSETYFQLVSNTNQDRWYVFSINSRTGSVLYQAELNSRDLASSQAIPNHFTFVPQS